MRRISLVACLIFVLVASATNANVTRGAVVDDERETVVNETMNVPAGELRTFSIDLQQSATVVGRFDVQNSRMGDIWVLIIPTAEYDNMRNKRGFISFYSSGKVVSGSINVSLRPGSYLLVFSNLHSLVVGASLTARVETVSR